MESIVSTAISSINSILSFNKFPPSSTIFPNFRSRMETRPNNRESK